MPTKTPHHPGLFILLAMLSVTVEAAPCLPLASSGDSPYNEFPPRPYGLGPDSAWGNLVVEKAGSYCLKNNLRQHKALVIAEGGWKISLAEAVLTLWHRPGESGPFDIDLESNEISSTQKGMPGISSDGNWPATIHDGTIRVIGGGAGVSLKSSWQGGQFQPYRLQNVVIRSEGTGVSLSGNGSVIRHCVIEVDDRAAIDAAGSGLLIEDNTIIVHGQQVLDTPIVLRHADGAIVRHNKILYSHFFGPDRPAAVRLEDSKDVQFLDNELHGFSTLLLQPTLSSDMRAPASEHVVGE